MGSTVPGLEILQAGVFGESLSGARLPQRCDGLGIGNLHSERQAVMQRYLSVKQRDRRGWRQTEPREDLFGLALQLRFNAGPNHFGLGHLGHLPVLLADMYPKRGTYQCRAAAADGVQSTEVGPEKFLGERRERFSGQQSQEARVSETHTDSGQLDGMPPPR